MHRRIAMLCLLLCAFWQGTAMAGWLTSKTIERLEHSALHGAAAEHHHHVDGSLHVDDFEGGLPHAHGDHDSTAPCLLSSDRAPAVVEPPPSPPPAGHVIVVAPYLEGPLRPPRSLH